MKTFNFLFIISAFFIIGCAPDLDFEIGGGEGDTHISGKVTDLNTGEPIDSVKFVMRASQFMGMSTWYPISDTTDSTGNFEFYFFCEEGWFYDLEVSKDGYSDTESYGHSIEKAEDNYFLINMKKVDSVKIGK